MRCLALLLACGAVLASDSFVDPHDAMVQKSIEDGNSSAFISAYEKPETMHSAHYGEVVIILGVLFLTVACLSTHIAKFELTRFLWGLGLGVLALIVVGNCGLELLAYQMEAQFGEETSFRDSLIPAILLEGGVFLIAIVSLYFGPPRGWDGNDDLNGM